MPPSRFIKEATDERREPSDDDDDDGIDNRNQPYQPDNESYNYE